MRQEDFSVLVDDRHCAGDSLFARLLRCFEEVHEVLYHEPLEKYTEECGTRCRTRTDMLLLVRKALEPLSYPGIEKGCTTRRLQLPSVGRSLSVLQQLRDGNLGRNLLVADDQVLDRGVECSDQTRVQRRQLLRTAVDVHDVSRDSQVVLVQAVRRNGQGDAAIELEFEGEIGLRLHSSFSSGEWFDLLFIKMLCKCRVLMVGRQGTAPCSVG